MDRFVLLYNVLASMGSKRSALLCSVCDNCSAVDATTNTMRKHPLCCVRMPEIEWGLDYILSDPVNTKVERLHPIPQFDYSHLTFDLHSRDDLRRMGYTQYAPAELIASTPDMNEIRESKTSDIKCTSLLPIGFQFELRDGLPSAVFEASFEFSRCPDVWGDAFRGYKHFVVDDYYDQTNTHPRAVEGLSVSTYANASHASSATTEGRCPTHTGFKEACFYYDVVLDGEIDRSAPVPMFGKAKNSYIAIKDFFVSTARVRANKKQQSVIAKGWFDYVVSVAMQYYCVVRKRFMVLDTAATEAKFNQARLPYVAMMFFMYDDAAQHSARKRSDAVDSSDSDSDADEADGEADDEGEADGEGEAEGGEQTRISRPTSRGRSRTRSHSAKPRVKHEESTKAKAKPRSRSSKSKKRQKAKSRKRSLEPQAPHVSITTKAELLAYANSVGLHAFCKSVAYACADPDPNSVFSWSETAYDKVFANVWVHMNQARFREQYIDQYVELIAVRLQGLSKGPTIKMIVDGIGYSEIPSPFLLRPRKTNKTNTVNVKNMGYEMLPLRTTDDKTIKIVQLMGHLYFDPINAVMNLELLDTFSLAAKPAKPSSKATPARPSRKVEPANPKPQAAVSIDSSSSSTESGISASSIGESGLSESRREGESASHLAGLCVRDEGALRRMCNYEDVIFWQLSKFTPVSREKDINAALRAHWVDSRLVHDKRPYTFENMDCAGDAVLGADRIRFTESHPFLRNAMLFHPRDKGSPFQTINAHSVHAPLTSPAGISFEAFDWMLNRSQASLSRKLVTSDGFVHIPGVLVRAHASAAAALNREQACTTLVVAKRSFQPQAPQPQAFQPQAPVSTPSIRPSMPAAPAASINPQPDASPSSLSFDSDSDSFYIHGYRWTPRDREPGCFTKLITLYGLLGKPLAKMRDSDIFDLGRLLLCDESLAVRLVYEAKCNEYSGDRRHAWKMMQASYLKKRSGVLAQCEEKANKYAKIRTFFSSLANNWDGVSAIKPSAEAIINVSDSSLLKRYVELAALKETLKPDAEEPSQESALALISTTVSTRADTHSNNIPAVFNFSFKGITISDDPADGIVVSMVALLNYMCVFEELTVFTTTQFPRDVLRYGFKGSMSWADLSRSDDCPFPVMKRMLASIFRTIDNDPRLLRECSEAGAWITKRKLSHVYNNGSSSDEAGEAGEVNTKETPVLFTAPSDVAQFLFSAVSSRNAMQLEVGGSSQDNQWIKDNKVLARFDPYTHLGAGPDFDRLVARHTWAITLDLDLFDIIQEVTLVSAYREMAEHLGSTDKAFQGLCTMLTTKDFAKQMTDVQAKALTRWFDAVDFEEVTRCRPAAGSGSISSASASSSSSSYSPANPSVCAVLSARIKGVIQAGPAKGLLQMRIVQRNQHDARRPRV